MPANTIHRNEEAEDGPAEGACVGLLMVLLSAEDPLLGFLPPPVEAGEEAKWFVRLWICIFFRRF